MCIACQFGFAREVGINLLNAPTQLAHLGFDLRLVFIQTFAFDQKTLQGGGGIGFFFAKIGQTCGNMGLNGGGFGD